MLDVSFLPLSSLAIPFVGAFLLLCFYAYHRLIYKKCKVKIDISRKHLNALFLIVLIVNFVVLTFVWLTYNSNGATLFAINGRSWTRALSAGSRLDPASFMHIDAIGAISAFLVSLIALVAGLRALADHRDVMSTLKASFMLLTLGSVQGVLYSNNLFTIFFFIAASQASCLGLYHNVPEHMKTFVSAAIYYFSRIIALAMLAGGIALIQHKYGTDIITVLSPLITPGRTEKLVFALMSAPLLYMFLQPPLSVADSACRCVFGMRTQIMFFAMLRVVFSLFGPMQGLEKTPMFFILLGFLSLLTAVMFAIYNRDPLKFAGAMELFMKGFILIALGLSINGSYSAEATALYGFSAFEGMSALWMIFLPFSAALSIICCFLKSPTPYGELWESGGLFRVVPVTCAGLLITICCITGLPPFTGYMAKQFIYRVSNYVSPFLTAGLFFMSIVMLLTGLKYFSAIAFGPANSRDETGHVRDSMIALPISFLTLYLLAATFMPGWTFEKCISPSAEALMNRSHSVNAITQWGHNNDH